MTRAKDHLLFSAGDDPNTFLEELPVDIISLEPAVDTERVEDTVQSQLTVSIPQPNGPDGYSPHSLMSDEVYKDVEEGRGQEFGSSVHTFAEQYALGDDVDPRNEDERNIKGLLDSLEGTPRVEEQVSLPLESDGDQVTISGVVDLVHVTADRAEIIDYKTDRGRHAESEYRTQLSVYYHALDAWFEDQDVSASIYYSARDSRVEIEPLSKEALTDRLETRA